MTVALLAVHPKVRDIVFAPGLLEELSSSVELHDITADLFTGGWPAHPDAELVITGWGTPEIDPAALAGLPRLAAIFHTAGSVRDVTCDEVWDRSIQVVSAADSNNESVADFVLAQIILALKGAHRAPSMMRTERRLPGFGAGPGTLHQVVGLVSFGSIARKVRERLARFGTDVLVWDPYVHDADLASAGVRRAPTLKELFDQSAVVSVHTPLIPGMTENLITRDLLTRLRPNAVLLNTARGAIIDEPALISILQDRPDLLAVLDVTWPEPPDPGSPLFELPNALLTGHTAGSVGTENQRMGDIIRAEIHTFTTGEALRHAVTAEQARLRA